ncbi:MAG TPA: translation initiation factor IF-3, partial [Candidatus Kapabacteria bacterium]|nr:translation initiation factor IF-3 [Candidatus Kapabacteria bacterium]
MKSAFVVGNPNFGKQSQTKEPQRKHRINNEITAKEVRVVDTDGGMLGIMSIKDALKLA